MKQPLDDARLSLPDNHAFRYYAPEPTPAIRADAFEPFSFRTADKIEAERKAGKQRENSAK